MRLWALLAASAVAAPVVQVRADAQAWAPPLAELLARVGAAAPVRRDAPLTSHTGTAFWSPDGELTTTAHTVAGASRVLVVEPGGEPTGARVIALDAALDVARLAAPLAPAAATWATAEPGAAVTAVGFPADRGPVTLTGRLLGTEALAITGGARPYLTTTISARAGLSGAPVLDAAGAVLGMVIGGRRTDGRDEGPALALPAEALLRPLAPADPGMIVDAAPDLTWRDLALAVDGDALRVIAAPPRLRALGWRAGRRLERVAHLAASIEARAELAALRGPVVARVDGGVALLVP